MLKSEGWIYGHQQSWSIEGLRLDDVDVQGVLTANTSDCESVEVETEFGLGQKRTRWKQPNKTNSTRWKWQQWKWNKTGENEMNCQIMDHAGKMNYKVLTESL